MRHPRAAFLLLTSGMFASYCWKWVPEEHQALVWNVSTAALVIVLLAVVASAFGSREVVYVAALLGAFKAMVVGCSLWFLVKPWPIRAGDEMCSARLDLPLGLLGLAGGAILSAYLFLNRGSHG